MAAHFLSDSLGLVMASTEMAQKRISVLKWISEEAEFTEVTSLEVEFLLFNGWGQRVWRKQELQVPAEDVPHKGDSTAVLTHKLTKLVAGVTLYVDTLRGEIDNILEEQHSNPQHVARFSRVAHYPGEASQFEMGYPRLDMAIIANTKIAQ